MRYLSPSKASPSKINLTKIAQLTSSLLLSSLTFAASAAPIPYADLGTENAIEYTFTAANSGDIVAYFVGKGGATYSDTLGISINGVTVATPGLNNQGAAYGQSLNLGYANAGDVIVFSLKVADTGKTWFSQHDRNVDGLNHVYSSAYAGDELVPTGTYVAFEDLGNFEAPDFNYLDAQFVVTNVTTPANVPVPAALWLFGSGLLGLAGVTRSRSKVV